MIRLRDAKKIHYNSVTLEILQQGRTFTITRRTNRNLNFVWSTQWRLPCLVSVPRMSSQALPFTLQWTLSYEPLRLYLSLVAQSSQRYRRRAEPLHRNPDQDLRFSNERLQGDDRSLQQERIRVRGPTNISNDSPGMSGSQRQVQRPAQDLCQRH